MKVRTNYNYVDTTPTIEFDIVGAVVQGLDTSVITALQGGVSELSADIPEHYDENSLINEFSDALDFETDFQNKTISDFFDRIRDSAKADSASSNSASSNSASNNSASNSSRTSDEAKPPSDEERRG